MKKGFFIVLLFLPLGLLLGQNTYLNIPIFQGCEKFENNKAESSKCFSEKFTQAISDNINSDLLNQIYWNNGKKVVNIKIKFRVNKNGIIEEVQSIGESGIELFQQVLIAIQKINQNRSEEHTSELQSRE